MSEPVSARLLEAVRIAYNGHVACVVDLPRAAATRFASCQRPPTAGACPPARPPTLSKSAAPYPRPHTLASRVRLSVAMMTAEQILNTHLLTLNAKDMEGKWLGPVPIEKWLNDFRPTNRKQRRERRILFNTIKTTVNGETNFANVINESGVLRDLGLCCKETHNIFGRDVTTDADHTLKLAPGASFIGNKDLEMDLGHEDRLQRLLGDVLFFGDLKGKNSQDLCWDLTSAEERELLEILAEELDKAEEESFFTRGKFACYARAICANSHRTHLYAFVILPDFARLLYFDRSGVGYSSLFDWKNTDILEEFIESFAEATPLQRGIDTSVTNISAQDDLVDKAQTIFTEAYDAGDVLPDEVTWDSVFTSHASKHTTYWLCNVYDEASKSFHRVVTHRAHTSSPYFAGRATRGYIGVDIDEGVVAYMKRSWRIDDAAFPKEIDNYYSFATRTKEGKSVPHLPGCYFGGDVPRDSDELAAHYFEWKKTSKPGETWTLPSPIELTNTRTSKYADDVKVSHPKIRRGASALGRADLMKTHTEMTPYTLTVTLFRRIGSKLRDFKSTRDLCVAFRDAIEAHEAALELKNVLHRDISDGNILIAKVKGEKGEVEGLLIDWDLCIDIQKFGAARRKGRTVSSLRLIPIDVLSNSSFF
ncbi:hypothetical protein PENSPDRAFT_195037 [Peniophora sp. CONT]|nr:hypothetical protein PENSPDRAFT_195037 [Peniophora sp. CONT]